MNIANIRLHIDNINSVLGTVRYLCKSSEIINTECHNMLEPLTTRYREISQQYSSISHLLETRTKRGAWIGGVGTVFKHIFGTLDEDDAIKYDNAITVVQNNNKELASLIKQNILVTSSVISSYNHSLHKLKINEDSLNEAVDKLSVSMKNVTVISNKLIQISEINSILNNLESSILALSFQLEDLINACLFCSMNVLHPSIITPSQLFQELADNHRYLPNGLELGVSLDLSSMHSIMNISKLICYYLNYKVVFVLQIPLVTSQEFYLYHNIPLPVPHNVSKPDSFTLVIPGSKYTAITKDKIQYTNIDSLEVCKSVNSQNYICYVMNVLSVNANPSCESELLSKVIKNLPVQCKTEFLKGDLDIWKKLMNNKWIFVQSHSVKLSIDCINSELVEENIHGIGVLTLPKYCVAYCKNTKLYANNNFVNITAPLSSFSNFNLINDPCCNVNTFKESISNVPHITLQDLDTKNIDVNYNEIIKSFEKNLDKIINEPHIIKYGAHYSVLTILIIITIICYIIFRLYSKLYKSNSSLSHSNSFKSPESTSSKSPTVLLEVNEAERQTDKTSEIVSPAKLRINV